MNSPAEDTIAAIATPPGRGGISIIRISGAQTCAIAREILGAVPAPRHAILHAFRSAQGDPIDRGLALMFQAPHSYTGEDVLELHGHGGPVVADMLLQRVVSLGARLARPGEFSERAFLNGKLDLSQAEAIADLIDSHTEQAARSAMRSLQGEFSAQINVLVEGLTTLRTHVEAALDFPDEEIDFLADERVASQLGELQTQLREITATAQQGNLLREGVTLVIAGPPNAGKSTLMNWFVREEAAIVTDIPGTTRDVLIKDTQLDGLPLRIIDTAGLRDSADPIEQEGVRRAYAQLENADLVLMLIDDSAPDQRVTENPRLPDTAKLHSVRNKIDLTGKSPGARNGEIYISAKTTAGLDTLGDAIKAELAFAPAEGVYAARRRHLVALQIAQDALARAAAQLNNQAGELMAEELRAAQRSLGEITGEVTTDDLLGRIFSTFCIGK